MSPSAAIRRPASTEAILKAKRNASRPYSKSVLACCRQSTASPRFLCTRIKNSLLIRAFFGTIALHARRAPSATRTAECRQRSPRAWRLGFWSLIATQFQGAFNDNALKFLVIFLIIGNNLSPDEEELKVLVIGSLFALPFILFSMVGGYFADRYSKRSVTIWTKVFEIGAMIFAIVGVRRCTT